MWATSNDLKRVKPAHLLNEKLVHLVDDNFQYIGFRNTKHTEIVTEKVLTLLTRLLSYD
jgi:hypothetical protein